MVAWHIPLAISGQQADLPRGSLTFAPKLTEADKLQSRNHLKRSGGCRISVIS